MVRSIQFFFIFFFISLISVVKAQSISYGGPIPFKPLSPLFGKDIVIHDSSSLDQRNIAICSAFNGWLYAVYSYPIGIVQACAFLKSTDNGINWEILGEGGMTVATATNKLDIVVCGTNVDSLKIFVGFVYFNAASNMGGALLIRYNEHPFAYEDELLQSEQGKITDLSISSDYMYPSSGSSPYSLGALFSKSYYNKDSIIFRSSSNGGISLDTRRTLAVSLHNFTKVSLNYGRSPSWSGGRYFCAWEEIANPSSNFGHIYTAHSEPNFNSAFTQPICIDSINLPDINKVRNPSLACQFSNVDNASSNFTEVIMYDKYLSASNNELKGVYNLQSTISNSFIEFSVSSSNNDKIQPNINFNPYNSTFMLTYFDSTDRKLPFLTNDVNLSNPNQWDVISQGYNDNSILISPYPKVKINDSQQQGMNAWISEGTNNNGVALFDSPYSTYTNISELGKNDHSELVDVYPNPCNSIINFYFELKKSGNVIISLYNILGQPVGNITDQFYNVGKNNVAYNVKSIQNGIYNYNYQIDNYVKTGKIIISK